MMPEVMVKNSARQLDLFQKRTPHLKRLPRQTRQRVEELTAELLAAVWQATREARAAAQRELGDE